MGDMADDAIRAAFDQELQFFEAVSFLRGQGCSCTNQIVSLNDDGLFECSGCGRVTDV